MCRPREILDVLNAYGGQGREWVQLVVLKLSDMAQTIDGECRLGVPRLMGETLPEEVRR